MASLHLVPPPDAFSLVAGVPAPAGDVHLGKRLYTLRTRAGWSVAEVAARWDLPRDLIPRLEAGGVVPNDQKIVRWLRSAHQPGRRPLALFLSGECQSSAHRHRAVCPRPLPPLGRQLVLGRLQRVSRRRRSPHQLRPPLSLDL